MVAFSKPSWRRGYIKPRLLHDSHAFLVPEKFDTWLDLNELVDLVDTTKDKKSWDYTSSDELPSAIDRETLEELRQLKISPGDLESCRITPSVVALLGESAMTKTVNASYLGRSNERRIYDRMLKAARIAWDHQYDHWEASLSPALQANLAPAATTFSAKFAHLPTKCREIWSLTEDFNRVLHEYKQLHVYRRERDRVRRVKLRYKHMNPVVEVPSLGATVTLLHSILIFEWKGIKYLMNRDQLLEVINKLTELWCALLYAHFQEGVSMPEGHYSITSQFLLHCFNAITKHTRRLQSGHALSNDNRGYLVLKSMEGLMVSELIKRGDADLGWLNDTLQGTLWKNLRDDGLIVERTYMGSSLERIFSQCTMPQLAEIVGLVKVAGHPSIQVERGLQKLYERTHAHLPIDFAAVERTRAYLKRDIVKQVYIKTRRYPNVDLTAEGLNENIRLLIERRIDLSSTFGQRLFTTIPIVDWDLLEFGQNAIFDPIDNQLEILKDKALGVTRTKIYNLLMGNMSREQEMNLMKKENRRALLMYLLHDNFTKEVQDYLAAFEASDTLEGAVLDYLVIKLTPKELEFKEFGRMFGASPYPERNRRIIMDKNMMTFMDMYDADQLMTPDELSLVRKMYSFRHFASMYPNHTLMQVSFDFSKWNNNFRRETVDHILGPVFNPWFNKRLYDKIMLAFNQSLVYYKDRSYQRWWDGQEGGIEGLSQPSWSIAFKAGLNQALTQLGYRYRITVKGDDVRAVLAIPDAEIQQQGHGTVRDRIMGQLQTLCEQMGWELNPNESFVSLSVICTSKQYQINDTWLPSSSKKMTKLSAMTNLVFPTLEDIVGSIFSTAHSAAAQSTVVTPCFASALVVASREVTREFGEKWADEEALATLLMWPQVLGGPGALPLQTFFVRGENDMLSCAIALFRTLVHSPNLKVARYASRVLARQTGSKSDPVLLLGDPYAIPTSGPERPAAVLKRIMRVCLTKITRNKELRAVLSSKSQKLAAQLRDHLLSMRPYAGKVATSLWESSVFYLVEEVLAKFMQSGTIFEFLCQLDKRRVRGVKRAHEALTLVLRAASGRLRHWAETLTHGASSILWLGVDEDTWRSEFVCPTQITHIVRETAWGFPIVGVTYPSLTTQNLLFTMNDLVIYHPHWPHAEIVGEVTILNRAAVRQTDSTCDHYMAAPGCRPWLGATTRANVQLGRDTVRVLSANQRKILKLVAIARSGDYLGPQYRELVSILVKALTTINVEGLLLLTPESGGGHEMHRGVINSFSMTTMPNYRPNLLQVVNLNSEGVAILRGDTRDRTINFAARHYYLSALAAAPLMTSQGFSPDWPQCLYAVYHWDLQQPAAVYELCPWCNFVVEDGQVVFTEPPPDDLSHFSLVPLLGSSEYEDLVLLHNIDLVQQKHARQTAAGLFRNEMDEGILEVCAALQYMTMSTESKSHLRAGRLLSAVSNPASHIKQLIHSTSNLVSLSSVSLNTIRLIPGHILYRLMACDVIHYLVDTLSKSNTTLANATSVLQAPNNPYLELFNKFITAGVMHHISLGASWTQEHDNIGAGSLVWRPLDNNIAHSASVTFMKHLVPAASLWVEGQNIPGHGFYQQAVLSAQPNHDSLIEFVTKRRTTVLRVARARIVAAFRGWLRDNYRNCFGAQEGLINQGVVQPEDVDWEDVDLQLGHIVFALMPEDFDLFEANLYMLNLLMSLEQCLVPTQDEDFVATFEGPMTAVLQLMEWGPREDIPWNPDRWEDNENYVYLIHRLPVSVVWFWLRMLSAWIQRMGGLCRQVNFDVDEGLENFLRDISWFNRLRVGVCTQEDADRYIRMHGAAFRTTFIRDCEAIEDHRRLNPALRVIHNPECLLGAAEHLLFAEVDPPSVQPRQDGVVRPWAQVPYGIGVPVDPRAQRLSNLELLRCVGHANTSVCKYLQVIDAMSIPPLARGEVEPITIVCLADGIGGNTRYFLTHYPMAQIVYNSLQLDVDTGHQALDASSQGPPLEVLSQMPASAVNRVRWQGFFPGDLSRFSVMQMISSTIQRYPPCALITMDADVNWAGTACKYGDILWHTALIAATCLAPGGVCIVKTFLINNEEIETWIKACFTMFRHVHITRNSVTREHSLEILVVLSDPVPLAVANNMYNRLVIDRQHYMMAPHGVLDNHLHRFANEVLAQVTIFRTTGLGPPVHVRRVYGAYLRGQAAGLELTLMLQTLGYQSPLHGVHWCQVWEAVCVDAETTAIRSQNHMLASYTNVRPTGIAARRRGQITTGRATEAKTIIDWLRAEVVCAFTAQPHNVIMNVGGHNTRYIVEFIHQAILDVTNVLVAAPAVDRFRPYIAIEDNHCWLHTEHKREDISMLLLRTVQRLYRFAGLMWYNRWILLHAPPEDTLVLLRQTCRDLVFVRPCCSEFFERLPEWPHEEGFTFGQGVGVDQRGAAPDVHGRNEMEEVD